MRPRGMRDTDGSSGFSLIELLSVIAIIAIMAAVALPNIISFFRNYQVRAAAQQVATEIQIARMQAIKKNTNYGVVFLVLSDRTYHYYFEDRALQGARQAYPTAVANGDASTTRQLPDGLEFVPAVAPADEGFRFNRLGAMCDPDVITPLSCPDLSASSVPSASGGPYVTLDVTAGATITVRHLITGLTRTVSVAPGGRIRVVQ